jgi:hypothetical protein
MTWPSASPEKDTHLSDIGQQRFEWPIIFIGGFLDLNEFVNGSGRASKTDSENHQKIHSMALLLQSLSRISSHRDNG